MSEKPVAQKLMIKEGRKVLFVNAPKNYVAKLGELPRNVTVLKEPNEPADIIQVFVANNKEMEEQLPKLKKVLNPGGMLWVTYHKGTSKVKTDINRDSIYKYALSIGLQGVATIAIDEDCAALRLKLI
ncbi:MAG: hypothetical protein HYU02_07165 [Thaumarchaeota archaeon]|nr:hypothetical protein [Nitrososphaerota archaeon]